MYFRHQLLGDEDLAPLYDLLIDESPLIRHAVGDLVYDHLIAQKFSSTQLTGILHMKFYFMDIVSVNVVNWTFFHLDQRVKVLKCSLVGFCRF